MTPWRLVEFAELDSTNRYACLHLQELQHGHVVQAGVQTGGRGRLNRSWVSHIPGNLCLSLVLKPEAARASQLPLASLSQLLAVSTCRALNEFKLSPTLKWPNDIQLGGRKVAGILAETVTKGSEFEGVVLGIGMNVNLDAHSLSAIDQPATSLSVELHRPISVPALRDSLLREIFDRYEIFMQQGFPLIRDEFMDRCSFLGEQIKVRRHEGMLHGKALDVDTNGALVVADAAGKSHVIEIAEMFL